jgi:predicted transcriptional regulator
MVDDFSFETDDESALLKELELLECLTQKRIEIMKTIAQQHPQSIRDLSRILDRNIKNVFEDLILLQKNKFISFEEKGKSKKPIMVMRKVVFYYKEGEKEDRKTFKVK